MTTCFPRSKKAMMAWGIALSCVAVFAILVTIDQPLGGQEPDAAAAQEPTKQAPQADPAAPAKTAKAAPKQNSRPKKKPAKADKPKSAKAKESAKAKAEAVKQEAPKKRVDKRVDKKKSTDVKKSVAETEAAAAAKGKVATEKAEKMPEKADSSAATKRALEVDWLEALRWRPIGPASMGGRIVDLEVVESEPTVFYVATASGGLFKTTNNGTTFSSVFENQKTVSIGDVAVSPSDPNVVWVGTGEHNARNSVSWGDGVYKSRDGGKTWEHRGLPKSFQIGRIAIHPTNPDVVYVGALGRLWGMNRHRGVYKTVDGGKSWQKVLFVDNKTGCIDIAMHPRDPDTLIVAMYERQRDEFDGGDPAKRWGPGSGLYRTKDGGENWKKLTAGLPTRPLGRIGVAYYRQNPNVVYALVESDKIGTGPATAYMGIRGSGSESKAVIESAIEDGPAVKAGLQAGDVVLEMEGKKLQSYNDLVVQIRSYKPGDKVKIKIEREGKTETVELTFGKRSDASRLPFTSYLGGQRANAQDRQGDKGFETGGIFKSADGGTSWERINSLNPRPFYYSQIRVDPSDDRNLYVMGVQLHQSSDGGKEFRTIGSRVHPDHHDLWINPRNGRHLLLGCDGGLYVSYDRGATWDFHDIMDIGQFYDVGVDTREAYWVYGGLQDNGSWGGPSRIRGSAGPSNEDWLRIGGGDGFVCRVDPQDPDLVYYEMQYGRMSRVNMSTGARASIRPLPKEGIRYRFNWKAPFLLSHHNSKIFYCAGNYVFRSLDRGNQLQMSSPKIARTDRGSATALSESPRDANVLYVGTDDGALWGTCDGGHSWQDLVKKVGLSKPLHVSSIEASRFEAGRAYVAFDGHRSNDDRPHLYVTEDFGETWNPLRNNLPSGSTRVLREDVANANLLYVGTEFGIWASVDRGQSWTEIGDDFPTVAVHEIAVHPTQQEIVAATHGRSLWVLDVTPLRQVTGQVHEADAHLFKPANGVLWAGKLRSSHSGHRHFVGRNPSFGSPIYYLLAEDAEKADLVILDIQGEQVRALKSEPKAGLHRLDWDLRRDPPPRQAGRPASRYGPPITPGTYLVRLTVDGKAWTQEIRVTSDPDLPAALLTEELEMRESNQRSSFIE